MSVSGQEALVLSFPDIHSDAVLHVAFQRTLRIPHDSRDYRLPDLGRVPLHPPGTRGGASQFALPLRPSEAVWLSLVAPWGFPFAVKVECAGLDALTGEASHDGLHREPQDYVPVPAQTWLDGCRRAHGMHQITTDTCVAREGSCGMRIIVYPSARNGARVEGMASPVCYAGEIGSGAGPGMRLHEDVTQDALAVEWDLTRGKECCIQCVTATEWRNLTGADAPAAPTPADYARAGVPWLESYSDES